MLLLAGFECQLEKNKTCYRLNNVGFEFSSVGVVVFVERSPVRNQALWSETEFTNIADKEIFVKRLFDKPLLHDSDIRSIRLSLGVD